jgi:ribosome recycling factor
MKMFKISPKKGALRHVRRENQKKGIKSEKNNTNDSDEVRTLAPLLPEEG